MLRSFGRGVVRRIAGLLRRSAERLDSWSRDATHALRESAAESSAAGDGSDAAAFTGGDNPRWGGAPAHWIEYVRSRMTAVPDAGAAGSGPERVAPPRSAVETPVSESPLLPERGGPMVAREPRTRPSTHIQEAPRSTDRPVLLPDDRAPSMTPQLPVELQPGPSPRRAAAAPPDLQAIRPAQQDGSRQARPPSEPSTSHDMPPPGTDAPPPWRTKPPDGNELRESRLPFSSRNPSHCPDRDRRNSRGPADSIRRPASFIGAGDGAIHCVGRPRGRITVERLRVTARRAQGTPRECF